jgi:PhnB protein
MTPDSVTYFAPQLTIKVVLPAIDFYKHAFGAKELRRWSNPDGSVHVAEMEISGAMFHIHEESPKSKQLSPESVGVATSLIGIFVSEPHAVVKKAESAGGQITSPVQDYDYGYRQGIVVDPFGHQWLIQKKI